MEVIHDSSEGILLSANESLRENHEISADSLAVGRLVIALEWHGTDSAAKLRVPLARGCPYVSMLYEDATPVVFVQRSLSGPLRIDWQDGHYDAVHCDNSSSSLSSRSSLFHVEREVKMTFKISDMTWMLFVSEPMDFTCYSHVGNLPPGVTAEGLGPGAERLASHFELRSVRPVARAMLRVALVNNCSTGSNPIFCGADRTTEASAAAYEDLLRKHADVYPSGVCACACVCLCVIYLLKHLCSSW